MIELILPGNPTPWASPVFSRFKVFDKRSKEKDEGRKILREIYKGFLISYPIKLKLEFYLPIPKHTAKSTKEAMEEKKIPHQKKPDLTNLIKLAEDLLKGIVIVDDNLVTKIVAQKYYSQEPRTIFTIIPF